MTLSRVLTLVVIVCGMAVFDQSSALAQGPTAFAALAGGNEVSGTTANAGDTNAYGAATVVARSATQLCYSLVVTGLDAPIAAHIHRGKAGVNGPIVVPLDPPDSGNPGTSSGCVAVDSALGGEIRAHPYRFYINVHSGNFQGGGVRGQLF